MGSRTLKCGRLSSFSKETPCALQTHAYVFGSLFTRKNGEQDFTHREMVKLFDDIVNEIKEEMSKAGRQDEFYGSRLIYSTLRSLTCEELEWYLNDCIELKKEFPHLIAGERHQLWSRGL